MNTKIYHQVGHNANWNIESLADGCGDGLILSPLHQAMHKVRELDSSVRTKSIFDPQYYLPNSPKPKLATYAFFPEQISGGFSTVGFSPFAMESAEQCVRFQNDMDFESIVIPTRFVDQMATKYFDDQEELTVRPFLSAAESIGVTRPLYLTLPVTSAMLMDDGFRTKLLNWVTGFTEISGVYVLVADERSTKQIQSTKLLSSYLSFVHEIASTGLKPVLGHLNTESLLFSIFDGVVLTFGSFENTRMFSLDKFIDNDEERRGPKARIYLPGLLNWVRYEQAVQIRDEEPELWADVYFETPHAERVFAAAADPTFNQPGLYKHHFECFSLQMRELVSVPQELRMTNLREKLKQAIALHQRVEAMPMDLDFHGNGAHLSPWLDALNQFYRAHLK